MTSAARLVAAGPWALLVAATLTSWLLAEEAADGRLATTLILLVAAFKIRLVVIHFMEVPWRARPWRPLLEFWVAAVTLVITVGYWATHL